MKRAFILCVLFILAFHHGLNAQYTQAFGFVTWPHSVSAFGTGEMGVASLTNDDALVYNPAKLTLTKNTKFSFYRNPYQFIGMPIPIASYTLYHNLANAGAFALNYEDRDYGDVYGTVVDRNNPQGYRDIGILHIIQRSFSIGFGKNITEDLSAGIQFRYSWDNLGNTTQKGYFVSLGGLYTPDFCEGRFALGFSLMNLGPAVKFESGLITDYASPPAKLNLGINLTAAENNYFLLPISLGISKPFDNKNESSFKTLFSDWKDFPNDAALHTGLSFIWKPLYLNENFAFFQEFYAGNFSNGIKTALENYYTHGMNIGFELYGFKFSAGYAGISHNGLDLPDYLWWIFPYETFQFTFELNDNLIFRKNSGNVEKANVEGLILSLGFGERVNSGDLQIASPFNLVRNTRSSLNYSAEAAFYFDKKNALVSSLTFTSIPYDLNYSAFVDGLLVNEKSKIETFSVFSSYRYHPLDEFHYLFIQGGLGIFRFNPVEMNFPKYDYKSAIQLAAGLKLDLFEPFILTPLIDYNLIFVPSQEDDSKLSGFNQFSFNLKIGYKIF